MTCCSHSFLKCMKKIWLNIFLSPNAPAIQCVITNANLIQVLQNDCMSFSKKKFIGHLIKTSHFSYLTISFKIVHRLPNHLYNSSVSRITIVVNSYWFRTLSDWSGFNACAFNADMVFSVLSSFHCENRLIYTLSDPFSISWQYNWCNSFDIDSNEVVYSMLSCLYNACFVPFYCFVYNEDGQ